MKSVIRFLIASFFLFPTLGFAATTTVPWLANTSTLFYTPAAVNGTNLNISVLGTGVSYLLGILGVGTSNPTAVNANAKLTVAGAGNQDIIASTTDITTSSNAILEAYSDAARVFMGAHGSLSSGTRYGLTLSGWSELTAMQPYGTTLNGLAIGTNNASPFVFGTNNAERMRLDSSGNLGIGTTSPGSLLSVGNTAGINFTTATSTFATGSGINLTGGCFAVGGVCLSNTASGIVGTGTTGQFPYYAANGTTLTATSSIFLATSGNVGIGTTTPTANLVVNGTTGQNLFQIASSTNQSVFLVDQNGNVGIGTSTPTFPLSITSTAARQFMIGYDTADAFSLAVGSNGNTVIRGQGSVGGFTFSINGTNKFTMDGNGWVSSTANGPRFSVFTGLSVVTPNYIPTAADQTTGFAAGIAGNINAIVVGREVTRWTQVGFGVGTTTPWARLSVVGILSSSTPLFVIASSTPTATTTAFMVTAAGHVIASSTSPVLSSCGTSPSMVGSDAWGTVTTGATASGCTVTFQIAYTAAPSCVVTARTGSVANTFSYTISTTALTVTETGLGGGLFDYNCAATSGSQ